MCCGREPQREHAGGRLRKIVAPKRERTARLDLARYRPSGPSGPKATAGGDRRPRAYCSGGSVRVKVAPSPGSLRTVISPPMARARSRLIASPSPVPSWPLVSERPSCTNG
jgi:hypothetical protein